MYSFKKMCLLLLVGIIAVTRASAQTEVTFYTTMGNFKIELTDKITPITVDSFLARVHDRFYDGLTFHRVIDNFMIQGGDPNGNGTGGPGYTIPDEFDPSLKNIPKALAMANTGQPHTGGCQFFINLVNNSHLNNKHTVFGMVTDNFTVVQNIGNVATDGNDKPVTPVVIDSIRVTKFPTGVSISQRESISVNIYPNPADGIFNVALPDVLTKVEVLNISGQVIYNNEAKGKLKIDLATQPAGVYTLRAINVFGKTEEKIIVQ